MPQLGNRRIVANLQSAPDTDTMADTCWAASATGSELVQAVIFAGSRDEERLMALGVPVPWQGNTTVEIRSVRFNGRENDPTFQEPVRQALSAVPSSKEGESGYVRVPVTLTSFQLVRLTPAGRTLPSLPGEEAGPTGLPADGLTDALITPQAAPLSPDSLLTARPARIPADPVDRLGPGCEHDVVQASRGTLPAWSALHAGQANRVEEVSPWSKNSDLLTFPGKTTSDRIRATRLYVDQDIMNESAWIAIWIRTAPDPGSTIRRRSPVIMMGSPEQYQKVTAGPEWKLHLLSPSTLKGKSKSSPAYITVWQDPSDPAPCRIEMNGFAGVGVPPEDAPKTIGMAGAMSSPNAIVVALVGKPEFPGQWHCRLTKPTELEAVKRIFRMPGQDRPEDAALAGLARPVKSGPGDTLSYRSGRVTVYYRPASQILHFEVDRFPARQENPSIEALQQIFSDAEWAAHSKQSIMMFQFDRKAVKP